MPPLWALADSEPFVIQNSAPKVAITINPTTPKLTMIFCNFTENFQRHGGSSCCTARSIFPVNLFTRRKSLLDKSLLLKSPPDLPVGNGVDWRVGDLPFFILPPQQSAPPLPRCSLLPCNMAGESPFYSTKGLSQHLSLKANLLPPETFT